MKKFHIKKGDTVIVNAGNDKGKTGKVLEVLRDKDRVIVYYSGNGWNSQIPTALSQ